MVSLDAQPNPTIAGYKDLPIERMMPALLRVSLLACLAVATTAARADDYAFGRRLFLDKAQCLYCHGWAGDGAGEPQSNGGANLRQSFLNREQLVEIIMCGRP